MLGGIDPAAPDASDTVAVLEGLTRLRCGEAFVVWARYQSIGVLYDRLVVERAEADGLIVDGFSDAAARISGIFAVSRSQAERMIDEAIVLRDDLPQVFGCLREGIVSIDQARLVISRTDLVRGPGTPPEVVAAVDEQIATTLRTRRGSWKRPRLRDMVDRIVFRQDPDAVRERRERALDKRGVFTDNCGDGVGEITAVMSAENVQVAVAAVRRLADAVCDGDGRTRQQRASDAMFALLSGSRFECACGSIECTAAIPEPGTVPPADPRFVIHVVCNEAALTAPEVLSSTAEPADSTESRVESSAETSDPAAGAAGSMPGTGDGVGIGADSVDDTDAGSGETFDAGTDADDGPGTWTVRVDRPRPDVSPEAVPVGFMDGYGIISAEHVRDVAARPDAVIHRVVPINTPENADGTFTLPAHGVDPYRPSTALDEAVRCRDGYCVDPGCSRSAWTADNDHVAEYDHHNPDAGGPPVTRISTRNAGTGTSRKRSATGSMTSTATRPPADWSPTM
ncbi:hypothetical protein GOACH_21_00710 [Gordonia aichiensis NBRC 108223]|uniref:DUF222 domain-containing protein n=1 Tax=Gordonia aichiensis NBRC 108223 TaxID=1220583 RepID=L7KR37_9ACTN|nr:hypothetical protein GOACH_21_00710 [Gordonia aichiensis NBRC 108223]